MPFHLHLKKGFLGQQPNDKEARAGIVDKEDEIGCCGLVTSYFSSIMSAKSEQLEGKLEGEGAENEVCASCGIAAVDDAKLKKCACNLVKYCTVDCQKNHRPQHKKSCKKRLAEMHDKQLFTQPDISHWGECPICCLPLSLDYKKSTMMGCCSNIICKGCCYANVKREIEAKLEQRCPFCRNPAAKSQEEANKNVMERVKKNDPVAMTQMGKRHKDEGDYGKAFLYLTNAAELGHVEAHCCLGTMYHSGDGVEKDTKKTIHHFEQAAIGGHTLARGYLAIHEMTNESFERAAKHLIIAANLGDDTSLSRLKDLFVQGMISKEEYAAALRAYQAAVNETKSAERDEAEAFYTRHIDANRIDEGHSN